MEVMEEKNKDEVDYCIKMIERVNKCHDSLNIHHTEALKYYEAQELDLGEKKGLSKTVVPTLSDAINWTMPVMMEIFTSNDETYYIKPRGAEDVPNAEKLSKLIDYQLRIKNNWFLFCHDWIQDSTLSRIGFAKWQWHNEIEIIEKKHIGLDVNEMMALSYKIENGEMPNAEIVRIEERILQDALINELGIEISPAVKEYDVTVKFTIEDEYPLIEAVSRENVGILGDTKSMKDAEFVCHKLSYDKAKFIKKFGKAVFNKIEKYKTDQGKHIDSSPVEEQRFKDVGGTSFVYDEKNDKWILYECYYNHQETGEPWITKLCGEQVILSEKNEYGRPPFEAISVFRQAHKLIGNSFHDLLKKYQELSTALLRNLVNNVYMTNQGRYLVDASGRVNLDDFKNNNVPGGYIRVNGSLQDAVEPIIPPMLQPWAFELYERVERMIEYRSGVPRAYKGVDIGTLQKTFRGQNQQISQASQIIKMMARLIAEMGFVPLIQDIVFMNQKFLKKKTAFRVLNEDIVFSPDDAIVKCDVIVNIGIGADNKDMIVMRLQQLLGIFQMIFKAKLPVITAQNVYHSLGELIKAMGFKNKNDFITDPKFVQSVQGLLQILMGFAPQLEQIGIPVPPQLQDAMQKVMANLGMGDVPQKKQGSNNPPKNIEKPAAPLNPTNQRNSMNPVMTGDGNGFFS